jgi:hypothetical protein
MKPDQTAAGRWRELDNGHHWLDHLALDDADIERLQPARRLTLWNVKVPPNFYRRLPNLEELIVEGGSARDLVPVREATQVRRLVINQIRGVRDLDWLGGLPRLESLALFGLAQVTALPSFAELRRLRFVQVGQMVRLHDLSGIALAPAIEELRFTQRLGVTPASMKPFVGHPTLARFGWWWSEGVPASQGNPVLEALPLARPDFST